MTADGLLFNSAILSSTLILVGLGLGFLILKVQKSSSEEAQK